jgi:carbamoyltransferase
MIVLGFSIGHDRGAVLIKNGEVVIGITDERLTRIKHDGAYSSQIPIESLNYCVNNIGITYDDVDLFVYNHTENVYDVESQFVNLTNQSISKLKFIPHHLAHAFSTFHSSGFNEAVVLVADAMGSPINEGNPAREWYIDVIDKLGIPSGDYQSWAEGWSIYKFTLNSYEEVYKKWVKWPLPYANPLEENTIGGMYGQGARQLVYDEKTNSWQSGKLMGLASYADNSFVENNPHLHTIDNDGMPIISADCVHKNVNHNSDFFTKANIAGIYQREQETLSMLLVEQSKKLTNSKNICVAGGSFLNCNTNEMIIKSCLFENAYFIPPADDSGIPLGCAWYAYCYISERNSSKMLSPYFGKSYSNDDICKAFSDKNINQTHKITFYESDSELLDRVSDLIIENKVIGWFQGGSEIGPRALGNRSILANPTKSWMTNYVNDLKGREWYRPFAPSVLHEYVDDIFNLDVYSPYMLVTTQVKPKWRNKIPAVTHIDYTARYQSVTRNNNQKYYDLIYTLNKKIGIPIVLNTSFNGPSEPIVETPLDAINTMLNRNMSTLCIENFLIEKL